MLRIFLLTFFCLSAYGKELKLPALTSPVMDLAHLLKESEIQDLANLAYEIHANNGPQITILTVPDLQGEVIENFSMSVAENWQLGSKEKDNGLLVVIARGERQMRIEVGNGIEGEVTDFDTAKFTKEIFPAYFKRGEFHPALRFFMEEMATKFQVNLKGERPRLIRRNANPMGGKGNTLLLACLGILVATSILFKKPVLRGAFTGAGLSALGGFMGFAVLPIIVIFIIGSILGLIGIGNLLTALAMSGGHGRGYGGGGGGGGWSGGGGGFSGGGSSGNW